jgi:hypothetical protein
MRALRVQSYLSIGGLAVACATLPLHGCGSSGAGRVAPRTIDAKAGTYRGIGIGDRAARARERFGEPAPFDAGQGIFPPDADREEVGGPPVITPPRRTPTGTESDRTLRFPGVTYLARGGTIYAVLVTTSGGRTREDVGVGDPLARVKQQYPRATCDTVPAEYPYCEVQTARDRFVLFSNDPIGGISMAARPMH